MFSSMKEPFFNAVKTITEEYKYTSIFRTVFINIIMYQYSVYSCLDVCFLFASVIFMRLGAIQQPSVASFWFNIHEYYDKKRVSHWSTVSMNVFLITETERCRLCVCTDSLRGLNNIKRKFSHISCIADIPAHFSEFYKRPDARTCY